MGNDCKRILIVEDEEALLFGLRKLLQNAETQVDVARTLDEARTQLFENHYQAVITDLRLTGATSLEGFDVVKIAKERQIGSKVIVLTAYAENDSINNAKELGVDIFLEKPVSPKRIKDILKSLELSSPSQC